MSQRETMDVREDLELVAKVLRAHARRETAPAPATLGRYASIAFAATELLRAYERRLETDGDDGTARLAARDERSDARRAAAANDGR